MLYQPRFAPILAETGRARRHGAWGRLGWGRLGWGRLGWGRLGWGRLGWGRRHG